MMNLLFRVPMILRNKGKISSGENALELLSAQNLWKLVWGMKVSKPVKVFI
jgi:hypothetical protein